MSSVLYITRNGMLEALGQSQVLAYLRGLSHDNRITLVSFEKPSDLAQLEALARVRADCVAHGICWLPQRFRHRPRLVSALWNMAVMLWLCVREVRNGNAELIHARSYVPSAVALLVNRLSGTPFVFDMRALWPEELITAGRLRRGSITHRVLVWLERKCLAHSASVISLTHAAEHYLRETYAAELAGKSVAVIPTCADLDRFVPLNRPIPTPRVYGCVGTVLSGWFRLDLLSAFFRVAAARDPEARFEIVTQDDARVVREKIDADQRLASRLTVFVKQSASVHEAIQAQDVSVMFFTAGLSKLGSSPTRMGEVLGCGLPIVANAGVGDVAWIIEKYQVGVLLAECSDSAVADALDALDALMLDPELPVRCRRAAEEVFSLANGTASIQRVWRGSFDDSSPTTGSTSKRRGDVTSEVRK